MMEMTIFTQIQHKVPSPIQCWGEGERDAGKFKSFLLDLSTDRGAGDCCSSNSGPNLCLESELLPPFPTCPILWL